MLPNATSLWRLMEAITEVTNRAGIATGSTIWSATLLNTAAEL